MFSVYIYIYSFWWSNPLYPPPMISWFVQVIKKKSVYLSFFLVSSKFWTPPKSSPGWSRCCIRLELASKTHGWNFQLCHITLVYWRIACCCIVVYSYIFVRVKLILENFFAWQCPKCCIAVCSITVEAFPYLPLIMSMSGRNFYDQMSNVYESVPLLFATDHVIFLLFRFRNFLGPNEQTQPGLFSPFSNIHLMGNTMDSHPGSHCTNYSFKFPNKLLGTELWTIGIGFPTVLVTYCCWKRSGSILDVQDVWKPVKNGMKYQPQLVQGFLKDQEYLHNTYKHRSSCRFWSMVAQ